MSMTTRQPSGSGAGSPRAGGGLSPRPDLFRQPSVPGSGAGSPRAGGGFSPRAGGGYSPRAGGGSHRDLFSSFGEDSVASSLLSNRGPRVRPPPSGPRDDAGESSKFRGRYSKSEIFNDNGRRHFHQASDLKADWAPDTSRSSPEARAASANGGSSPRGPRGGNSPRAGSPRAGTPSQPQDLFSVAPGAWTPMRRSPSRGGSPTGYGSPGPGATGGTGGQSSQVVAEAARRLKQADGQGAATPKAGQPARGGYWSPRSPRGSPRLALGPNGAPTQNQLCKAFLRPPPLAPSPEHQAALQPQAPSQMISSGVADLIKQEAPPVGKVGLSAKCLSLDRHTGRWTARRSLKERNSSKDIGNLIKGAPDGAASPERNFSPTVDVSSPRGPALGGRSEPGVPWALDDGSVPSVGARQGKLADVARSCLQNVELRIEAEQRLCFRPSTATIQAVNSGGSGGPAWQPTRSRSTGSSGGRLTNSVGSPGQGSAFLNGGTGGAGSSFDSVPETRRFVPPARAPPTTRATFGGRPNPAAALVKFASEVKNSPLQYTGHSRSDETRPWSQNMKGGHIRR